MVNAAKETKDSQIKSANEACEGIKNEIKKILFIMNKN